MKSEGPTPRRRAASPITLRKNKCHETTNPHFFYCFYGIFACTRVVGHRGHGATYRHFRQSCQRAKRLVLRQRRTRTRQQHRPAKVYVAGTAKDGSFGLAPLVWIPTRAPHRVGHAIHHDVQPSLVPTRRPPLQLVHRLSPARLQLGLPLLVT